MHRAVFYEFHGGDLAVDRIIYPSPAGDVTILLAGDPTAIPPMAAKLAEDGVDLIELCGGLPLAIFRLVLIRNIPMQARFDAYSVAPDDIHAAPVQPCRSARSICGTGSPTAFACKTDPKKDRPETTMP